MILQNEASEGTGVTKFMWEFLSPSLEHQKRNVYIPSGDLMGGLSAHQGYTGIFFSAENHDHSTISYSVAMIGGVDKVQPHKG